MSQFRTKRTRSDIKNVRMAILLRLPGVCAWQAVSCIWMVVMVSVESESIVSCSYNDFGVYSPVYLHWKKLWHLATMNCYVLQLWNEVFRREAIHCLCQSCEDTYLQCLPYQMARNSLSVTSVMLWPLLTTNCTGLWPQKSLYEDSLGPKPSSLLSY